MTTREAETPRDLTKNWCTEAESFQDASRRIDPTVWKQIGVVFKKAKTAEPRAAHLAYAFTGLVPSNEDSQEAGTASRSRAVDILLTDRVTSETQVMEVTTSLDQRYERSSSALRHFQETISNGYTGEGSWGLSLERGWETLDLRSLAPLVAAALSAVTDTSNGPHALHENVRGWRVEEETEPRVVVSSRNAGALNREDPYLNVLSAYLANDPTIQSKLSKLAAERSRLGATRSHLYIGMASTGVRGGLLPVSPSYFTWGEFLAPDEIDELWLDGNTGELYRWTRESGWVFHRLQ